MINLPTCYWVFSRDKLMVDSFYQFLQTLDVLTIQYRSLTPSDFEPNSVEDDAERIGITLKHHICQLVAWNVYCQVYQEKDIFYAYDQK